MNGKVPDETCVECCDDLPISDEQEIENEMNRPRPDYVPTQRELLALARYWAKIKCDLERIRGEYDMSYSSELLPDWLDAADQLRSIAKLVGEAEIKAILAACQKVAEV